MRTFTLRLPPSGPPTEVTVPETSSEIENASGVAGATVTDALDWLAASDVAFGGTLPDASADIDPTAGTLFYAATITADRVYTLLSAGAQDLQMVAVECRNAGAFTATLVNGGASPGDIVEMQNGWGYAVQWDGADWVLAMTYRINALP